MGVKRSEREQTGETTCEVLILSCVTSHLHCDLKLLIARKSKKARLPLRSWFVGRQPELGLFKFMHIIFTLLFACVACFLIANV